VPVAEINAYNLSLFVHVTAVVVGLGSTFAEALFFPVAMKLNPRHLPLVHRLQLAINQYFATPALLLIILTGIYQVLDADYSFGDPWISGSFAIAIAIGALNGAYFIPEDRKLGPMVEREVAAAGDGEVTLSPEYQARAKRQGMAGALTGVLVVTAIFLMVTKPGL